MPPKPQHLSENRPASGIDSDSDASFHSFHDEEGSELPTLQQPNPQPSASPAKPPTERFSPTEEATLLAESNSLKGAGNALFGSGSFSSAIQTYDRALSSCPNYLDYELAVLRSNIAACHLKLEEWKEAVESADKGIDNLERLEPLPKEKRKVRGKEGEEDKQEGEDDVVEEVDDEVEERYERLKESGRTLNEVRKLQIKLLMRRAKGKMEVGGWASLQGADEDYRTLTTASMIPCLSPTDRRTVQDAARRLTPMLNEAKEREMGEMMDKLKGLGNSILKPFGLSTENFQFVKDEKTGGYSMNFEQNPGKKKP